MLASVNECVCAAVACALMYMIGTDAFESVQPSTFTLKVYYDDAELSVNW